MISMKIISPRSRVWRVHSTLTLLLIIITMIPIGARSGDLEPATLPSLNEARLMPPDHEVEGWSLNAPQIGSELRAIPPRLPDGDHSKALQIDLAPQSATLGRGRFDLEKNLRDLDGRPFDHLLFWIKSDQPRGQTTDIEITIERSDLDQPNHQEKGTFTFGGIGSEWTNIIIPLNYFRNIDHWDHLQKLTFHPAPGDQRPHGGLYQLADLTLVNTGHQGQITGDQVVAEQQRLWASRQGGEAAARTRLRQRLAGWPATLLVEGHRLPKNDRAFLERLALDTWHGIDALTDKAHGLPLDRIEFRGPTVATDTTHVGDYTNITNIGMHGLAVTAAFDLGLITRKEAIDRLTITLNTLEHLESYRGFFYNYYNTTSLERTSNFISFVDSAWLTAGLMVIRQAFSELAPRASRLIDQGDYHFFFDESHQLMSHGHYVHLGQRSTYHYGMFYAEARLGSLIAIGRHQVPRAHWFKMARTLPPEMTWQSGAPIDRQQERRDGFEWTSGHYHWHGRNFVPSWGGSLFEALMPLLVLDELQHAPKSLGQNDRTHTALHRRHALEDLHYPVWGMSPSSTPRTHAYAEYGVRPLGVAGYPAGVVTPHAAALALMTEPQEAIINLRKLATEFKAYGDFGFYDAVDPITKEVATDYLCLNQAMILVALTNHLRNHAIQRHFEADPITQEVLPLLKIEAFKE